MKNTGFNRYYEYSPTTFLLNASVMKLRAEGEKSIVLVLDRTIFRPAGGGQAADKGQIVSTTSAGEVVHLEEKGDTVEHHVHITKGEFSAGDSVTCILDSSRRLALMRAHTGEHILARALQKRINVKPLKVHIEMDQGSIIAPRTDLPWETLVAAEVEANNIIQRGEPISIEYYNSVEEAKQHLGDATRIGIKGEVEQVRIIRIGNYDISACTGTHTLNSQEIIELKILNVSHSKTETCIDFATANRAFDAAKDIYNGMWPIGQQFTTGLQKLPVKIQKLNQETTEGYQQIKRLEALLIPLQAGMLMSEENISSGITWISKVLPYGDVKYAFKLMGALEDLVKRQSKNLWFIAFGIQGEGNQIVVKTSLAPEQWHSALTTLASGRGRIAPDYAIIPLGNIDLEATLSSLEKTIAPQMG